MIKRLFGRMFSTTAKNNTIKKTKKISHKKTVAKTNRTPKKTIPKALREQIWIQHNGRVFENKCGVKWCNNKIDVFNFDCGHNTPESKGGATDLNNLIPICRNCNCSMGANYTIDEWNNLKKPKNNSTCNIL